MKILAKEFYISLSRLLRKVESWRKGITSRAKLKEQPKSAKIV
jgi:uncharacterized protein YjiS (DUF1127 family)